MKTKFILLGLFIFAASYRVSLVNHPFWIDEFSSAIQARLINAYGLVQFFQQTDYYAEPNNILTHLLIAASFNVFGEVEWAARIPLMILGSLVPIFLFLVTKQLWTQKTALVAALLSSTSYFMITWSRQARGYALQQLLLLLIYSYLQIKIKSKYRLHVPLFIIFSVLGVLTHYFFGIFVVILLADLVIQNRKLLRDRWKLLLALAVGLMSLFLFLQIPQNLLGTLLNYSKSFTNNLWYYHALLWREETIITLFAALGILISVLRQPRLPHLIAGLIAAHLGLIIFFVPPYTSRYLAPIFPLLILFAAVFIVKFAEWTTKEAKHPQLAGILAIIITGFVILNGHMFTAIPRSFYSVNHVMRDIALVDYSQVYQRITDASSSYEDVAVIDTWIDRSRWYLGQNYRPLYWFRWLNQNLTINGLGTSTPVQKAEGGGYSVPLTGNPPVMLISSLDDLFMVLEHHDHGFIWIDDTTMSAEVIDYAKNNFYLELFLDHYPPDDNPYSVWPGTLYSWGFTDIQDSNLNAISKE